MSGSLVLIQETTVSSPQASVSLVGIDSSFEVYKVVINGYLNSTASGQRLRVTVSGTPDTTSNYDRGFMEIRSDSSSFQNIGTENSADVGISSLGTAGNESCQGIFYLYNLIFFLIVLFVLIVFFF